MVAQRLLVLVLVILGVLALIAGIVYMVEPAKSLSVLPGHIAGSTVHRTHRGIAALVVGAALLVAAAATVSMGRRRPA